MVVKTSKLSRLFFLSDLAIGIYKEKEGEITILHCCKNCCLIPNRQYGKVIPRSSNLWLYVNLLLLGCNFNFFLLIGHKT